MDTPIGLVPQPAAIDTDGLDVSAAAQAVHVAEWRAEIRQITEWFATFGDKLPTQLWTEPDTLKHRLLVR